MDPVSELVFKRLINEAKESKGKLAFVGLKDLLKLPSHLVLDRSEAEVHARKAVIGQRGLFSEPFYRSQYPDGLSGENDALEHYVTVGWTELRDPHPFFSTAFYLWKNDDVVKARIEPFTHYLEAGSSEFRDPHPRILSPFIAANVPTSKRKSSDTTWLEYAISQSDRNGQVSHPAFASARLTDTESPFFDQHFYKGLYGNWDGTCDPYVHYSTAGVELGASPSAYFDAKYYKSQAGSFDTKLDPIVHFLWKGERNGMSPHFFYDPSFYSKAYNSGVLEGAYQSFLQKGLSSAHPPNKQFAERKDARLTTDDLIKLLQEDPITQCYRLLDQNERSELRKTKSHAVASFREPVRPSEEAVYREYPGHKPRQVSLPNVMLVSHFCGEHMFGSERSFVDMADAIASMPANLTIVLPRNVPDYTNLLRAYAVRIIVFPYDWWRSGRPIDESVTTLLANIIQDDLIEVVHVNTLMLREPSLAARRLGIPTITHVREMVSHDEALCTLIGESASDILANVQARSDWLIANSRATENQFGRIDKISTLSNTVDFSEIQQCCNAIALGKRLRVGLISSNIEKKGVLDFLQLAKVAYHHHLTADFFLVGPPTALTQSLEAQSNEIPDNFHFSGYSATPASAIAKLDVVINFSHFAESFGRTVLEAMAGGRVVICYAWGALPELIEHGETGFLVPYREPRAALEFVQKLLNQQGLLETMGAAAKASSTRFEASSYRRNMAAIYARVFEAQGGRTKVRPVIKLAERWKLRSNVELKIAYFCWHFPVPSETFVLAELRRLVEIGHDVIVFCKQSPHRDFTPDFKIRFEGVKSEVDLADKLVSTGRNIVHAHFAFPTVTRMVWPACEIARVPFTFIAHAQDIFVHDNERQLRLAEICASPFCLKAFTLSRFHYDYMFERGFAREKLSINANAVDVSRFPTRSPRPGKAARKIIAVHRFVRKKGLDLLIRAASLLEDLDLSIEIYGYGDLENAYQELITSLQLENVRLLGALPAVRVMGVIEKADLFASPCVRVENGDMDGIPTSIVESMLAGVPVLTTDISGIPDLVVDGITGLVCEPNAAAVAAGIRRFYAMSDEQIATIVDEGRKRALRNHDSRRCVEVLTRVWSGKGVDVVIVAWNNLAELRLVVDRILAYTTLPLHLIICDNRSRKEPIMAFLDEIRQHDDRITVIENSVNAMVGPGTNLAAAQGTNDVVIYVCGREGMAFASGWELPFVRAFADDPEVGLVGTIGCSPSYLTGAQYPKGIRLFDLFRNKEFATANPDRVFGHVQGGLFAFRRKMFEEIGGFSEAVPHDYTDVEYSFYAESCGWKFAEAEGVLALFNKTRPTLSQRFDENVLVAHPVLPEQIERFEAVRAGRLKHCNVCDWYGTSFSCDDGRHCPECLASSEDRILFRWLSESRLMYRRLVAVCIGLSRSMTPLWQRQFQGPVLNAGSFLNVMREKGRLPNRSAGTSLIFLRGLEATDKDWLSITEEAARLGSKDCVVVLQNCNIKDQDVAKMRADGFSRISRFKPVSSAVALDTNPVLIIARS